MKVRAKLVLGFLAVTTIMGAVSYFGVRSINSNVVEIVERENPKVQAVLEMEINAKEAGVDVHEFLKLGDPEEIERFRDSVADFQAFEERFKGLIRTSEERELVQELAVLFAEYVKLGNQLIELKTSQQAKIDKGTFLLNYEIEVIIDDKLQEGLDPLTPDFARKQEALLDMEINLHELISAVRGYVLNQDASHKVKIDDSIEDFEYWKNQYLGLVPLDSEERQLAQEIGAHFDILKVMSNEIVEDEDEKQQLLTRFEQTETDMDIILDDKLQVIAMEKINADEAAALSAANLTLYSIAAALFLSIGIGLFIARAIAKPIATLTRATLDVANGKLDTRVDLTSRDELGLLADAFNSMAEDLQSNRDYVEGIIASMADSLVVLEPNMTIAMVNQATLDLLGYEEDDLVGRSVELILAEEEAITKQLQTVLVKGFVRDLSLLYRTKAGEKVPVSFSGAVMRDASGKSLAIVGVARDMREMNRLQAQLVQAGKMAGLGQLGAGIAHELNQPITSIQGFAQRLRRNGSAEMSEEMDIIIKATHRMARIVNNIRDFARQGGFNAESTNPLVPLDDALMLISEQLRLQGVEVEKKAEETLPHILADKFRLQQVFLNLIGNALDALDEVEEGSPTRLLLAIARDGDKVVYTIEDTGPGVPYDNEAQIFDPFFTTKPPGKGTGLGLSLSYGIVADHGGEIAYQRAPGGGARFSVRIPVVREAGDGSEKLVASGMKRGIQ